MSAPTPPNALPAFGARPLFTDLIADPAATATKPAAPAARERFWRLLETALQTHTLVRLVLGQYRGSEAGLERLLIRPIELRGQACLQLVWRYTTKDITKNHPLAEGLGVLQELIGPAFSNAHLETRSQEVQLTVREKGGKDRSLLRVGKSSAAAAHTDAAPDTPASTAHDTQHNREKQRLLSLQLPFWHDLGVTTPSGELIPAMARKWRQINKFTELFAKALADSPLAQRPAEQPVQVVDFGCGKGYLTFAMHAWLQAQGRRPEVTGVELREELVTLCNTAARQHGLQGLRFDAGDVRHYTPVGLDVMVALHACDIATDYAIDFGLRARAAIIMCSPCCHKQIRPQMHTPALLRPVLQHGVHLGQEAEMVTDGLRALLLDASGYDTQVFEFISLEHTNKNKMILAVRRPEPRNAAEQAAADQHRATVQAQIDAIKAFYGIKEQCLETLLQQRPPTPAHNNA